MELANIQFDASAARSAGLGAITCVWLLVSRQDVAAVATEDVAVVASEAYLE